MAEHYDPETLAISRRLYEEIRNWATRGGVTLIGGWAVFERVAATFAQQSRDVDLVVHDAETLFDFDRHLGGWGLQWRTQGRNRFNDCHLIGDDPAKIRVDVLKGSNFDEYIFRGFAMRGANPVKPLPVREWLPPTRFLVRDKLATIPLRVRDREDKRLKDFIDIHGLVFHNIDDIPAKDLTDETTELRARALEFLPAAQTRDTEVRDGIYAERLAQVGRWLRQ